MGTGGLGKTLDLGASQNNRYREKRTHRYGEKKTHGAKSKVIPSKENWAKHLTTIHGVYGKDNGIGNLWTWNDGTVSQMSCRCP